LEKDSIMVRKRLDAASVLTVPVLLNESQKSSSSGQLRYARMLWSLVEDDAETTVLQLMRGLKIFVTVAEVRWRACHWRFLLAEKNEYKTRRAELILHLNNIIYRKMCIPTEL
jgi:hypothetical protein